MHGVEHTVGTAKVSKPYYLHLERQEISEKTPRW